eukprot:292985-Chlamydomonas_euryale.AAC.3
MDACEDGLINTWPDGHAAGAHDCMILSVHDCMGTVLHGHKARRHGCIGWWGEGGPTRACVAAQAGKGAKACMRMHGAADGSVHLRWCMCGVCGRCGGIEFCAPVCLELRCRLSCREGGGRTVMPTPACTHSMQVWGRLV